MVLPNCKLADIKTCALLLNCYSVFSRLCIPSILYFSPPLFLWNLKPVTVCLTVLLLLHLDTIHILLECTKLHILWYIDTALLCSLLLFTIQKLREISLERKNVSVHVGAFSLRLVKGWLRMQVEGMFVREKGDAGRFHEAVFLRLLSQRIVWEGKEKIPYSS